MLHLLLVESQRAAQLWFRRMDDLGHAKIMASDVRQQYGAATAYSIWLPYIRRMDTIKLVSQEHQARGIWDVGQILRTSDASMIDDLFYHIQRLLVGRRIPDAHTKHLHQLQDHSYQGFVYFNYPLAEEMLDSLPPS